MANIMANIRANIRVSHSEDAVVTITLDRPHKKNALSVALREEVLGALEHLRSDEFCQLHRDNGRR